MLSRLWSIRNPEDVPFYCSPVHLFFTEWLLMLSTAVLQISYISFPDISVGLKLFGFAGMCFLAGLWTVRLYYKARNVPSEQFEFYRVNLSRLRAFHLGAFAVVVAVMLLNLKLYGLPPIFGFMGADTLDYQDYGSLRQPLFTCILVLFVSAPLESSPRRRWFWYLVSPACCLIYVSRGYLLVMLFQALAVFSLRTTLSKAKIYLVSGVTFVAAVLVSNFIGNSRNSLGVEALLGYLQIKHAYHDWPAAYLWVISYVSTPFSNMCWILRVYPYRHPSFSFLYSALPGFWSSYGIEQTADLGSEKIVDGVHTYMAKYFIDFWYFGIAGINYVWGCISALLTQGNRLTRNFLVSGVLLGCIAFMFFSDFLTILIIIMELVVLALLQRRVISEVASSVHNNPPAVPRSTA